MATMERARTEAAGFFGSVVGAATDGDALEPGMNASAAADDVDLGGGAGRYHVGAGTAPYDADVDGAAGRDVVQLL